METFRIEIQEFLSKVIEVDASNLQEAMSDIQERYAKAEIVLDYNDFVEVNFIDINTQSKNDEMKMLINDVIEYLFDNEKRHYEESEEPQNHIFSKLERLKSLLN